MYKRTNSLNITLEPYAESVRKESTSYYEVQKNPQNTCRICLQTCPFVELCLCRRSCMAHTNCLKQFIVKGQGTIKNKSKCEICGSAYNLVFNKKCSMSCKKAINYFKHSALASTLFIVFSILTIVYICYCLHINSLGVLDQNQQLILLIVGVCLIIVFLIVILRWIYMYLFTTVHILVDILPFPKPSIQLTQANLNESNQYLK